MKRLSAAIVIGIVFSLSSSFAQEPVPAENQIVFKLSKIEHRKGKVMCALHEEGDWLESSKKRGIAKITEAKTAECLFAQVPPGVYAIAAYHDENSNNELDSNFIGIPSEGIAISKMTKMSMGKPSFEDAKFTYKGGRLVMSSPMLY